MKSYSNSSIKLNTIFNTSSNVDLGYLFENSITQKF